MDCRRSHWLGLMPFISLMTGCAGCVGTGGRFVPLTPDPSTPVLIKIYNSDIHLVNDSEEDLRGMTISIRSALGGAEHSRSIGILERKGYRLMPSNETGWYLAEGEVLTVDADGHSPTSFTIQLSTRHGP